MQQIVFFNAYLKCIFCASASLRRVLRARSPGSRVPGLCKLPETGSRNRPQALCKSSMSHLAIPPGIFPLYSTVPEYVSSNIFSIRTNLTGGTLLIENIQWQCACEKPWVQDPLPQKCLTLQLELKLDSVCGPATTVPSFGFEDKIF